MDAKLLVILKKLTAGKRFRRRSLDQFLKDGASTLGIHEGEV